MAEVEEWKARQAAARGVRAKELLEHELLQEAFSTLESAYIAAWRSTTIDAAPAREKLFLAINVLGKVREHLQKVVADGTVAAADLRRLAEAAERQKAWHEIK